MAPIRVGFLGLSKSGWAPNAHLPYLKASPDYEIVALCNSSVDSSRAAIKLYDLPDTVRAYGDPQDLANDTEIDLVVCSIRVDRHFASITPSLRAGKDVFVEWPLGKSAAEARELLRLKNESGTKTAVVGLQARHAPIINKVKKLLDAGRIGDVLNSTWVGYGVNGGESVTEPYEYIGRKEVGGNLVTIHFGHAIDYVQFVLGYGFKTVHSILANRRPEIKLVDAEGKVINAHHPKTADDTIFLNGILSSSSIPLSFSLRGGKPFAGQPGLDWRIYGSEGEVRISAAGSFLNIGYDDMKIEVYDSITGAVEAVEFGTEDKEGGAFAGFPIPGRNVGRLYEGLAKGVVGCSFEDAVERHEFIERLYKENGYTEV